MQPIEPTDEKAQSVEEVTKVESNEGPKVAMTMRGLSMNFSPEGLVYPHPRTELTFKQAPGTSISWL